MEKGLRWVDREVDAKIHNLFLLFRTATVPFLSARKGLFYTFFPRQGFGTAQSPLMRTGWRMG